MRFLKNGFVALFLATSAVSGGAVIATPAQAATASEVRDLIDIRVAQLEVLAAEQGAIVTDPTSTTSEIVRARAAQQRIRFRISQLTAVDGAADSLPPSLLTRLASFLQASISAA